MLIPESGKPANLNIAEIKTVSDADRALLWLGSVLNDMATQVKDRGSSSPSSSNEYAEYQLWLKRLRAAERNTSNLRHRVLELRDRLAENSSVHEAIVATVFKVGGDDFIEDIRAQMEQDFPQLAGFDPEALRA